MIKSIPLIEVDEYHYGQRPGDRMKTEDAFTQDRIHDDTRKCASRGVDPLLEVQRCTTLAHQGDTSTLDHAPGVTDPVEYTIL